MREVSPTAAASGVSSGLLKLSAVKRWQVDRRRNEKSPPSASKRRICDCLQAGGMERVQNRCGGVTAQQGLMPGTHGP